MSIVIIGGNECMTCIYKEVCASYGCKAKVFAKMRDGLKNKVGSPDLMIVFTGTISHKMVKCAMVEAKRKNTPIERCHSSSLTALKAILAQRCGQQG